MNLQEFLQQVKEDLEKFPQDWPTIQARNQYQDNMEYFEWLEILVAYGWVGPSFERVNDYDYHNPPIQR